MDERRCKNEGGITHSSLLLHWPAKSSRPPVRIPLFCLLVVSQRDSAGCASPAAGHFLITPTANASRDDYGSEDNEFFVVVPSIMALPRCAEPEHMRRTVRRNHQIRIKINSNMAKIIANDIPMSAMSGALHVSEVIQAGPRRMQCSYKYRLAAAH